MGRGIPRGGTPSFPEKVREQLETILGVRGNSLDAAVTYRDLIETGYALPSGARGASGAGTLQPGPQADRTPPPKAVAPAANDAIGTTTLTWGVPQYGNHAFSEVWRSSTDDLSTAVLYARTPGFVGIFTAPLDYGETWYFWIRLVSTADVPGPWHATDGLQAVGATNVTDVLTQLSETLDFGALSTTVNAKLDEIDGIQSQVNDLTLSSLSSVFVETARPLPGVGDVPDPIPEQARWYDSDDNNHPHLWSPTSVRSSAFQWTLIADGVYELEAAGGGAPSIVEPDALTYDDGSGEVTQTRIADDSATTAHAAGEWCWFDTGTHLTIRWKAAADPDTYAVGSVEAYRWASLLDPRIGQNDAAITTLQSSVTDLQTDTTANADAISVLDTTVTGQGNDITALTTRTTDLETAVNNPSTGLDTKASLTQLATLESDIYGAAVTSFTQIDARFTSVESDVATRATKTELTQAEANIYGAAVTSFTEIDAAFTSQQQDIDTRATITQLNQTESDIYGASVTAFTNIDARFTSVDGDISNRATITQLNAVEARVGGVEAKWGVDLDVNGYITGIRLNNDGQTGTFLVRADRFVVGDPGDTSITPFAVVGGVTYIADAAIRNGSITDAKVGSLSASKITAGTMSANRISGGQIDANNVSVVNLSASNITTGTLNTSRINLDGLSLTNSGGLLSVKNGGVSTSKLAGAAVTDTWLEEVPSNLYCSANVFTRLMTIGGFYLQSGSTSQIFFTILTQGESSGPPSLEIQVRRFKQVGGSWSLDKTVFSHARRLNQDYISGMIADDVGSYAYYYYDILYKAGKNKYVYAGSTLSVTTLKK